jgi:hypothetical protein
MLPAVPNIRDLQRYLTIVQWTLAREIVPVKKGVEPPRMSFLRAWLP